MSSQNSAPRIILVTGGSRGLGRNTAISAARSGFDVIITYHSNRDAAAEVVNETEGLGRKAVAVRLDTADVDSFDAFAASLRSKLDRLGHESIHALVNNAGHRARCPVRDDFGRAFWMSRYVPSLRESVRKADI